MNNYPETVLVYEGLADREDVFVDESLALPTLERIFAECGFDGDPDPDDWRERLWYVGSTRECALYTNTNNEFVRLTTNSNSAYPGLLEAITIPGTLGRYYMDRDELIDAWSYNQLDIPRALWGDPDFVLAAMAVDGYACLECWSNLWGDPDFCWQAVQANGSALAQVPERYKTYRLCLRALQDDSDAVDYVPARHWRSVGFCATALSTTPNGPYIYDRIPTWIQALIRAMHWTRPRPTSSSAEDACWRAAAHRINQIHTAACHRS